MRVMRGLGSLLLTVIVAACDGDDPGKVDVVGDGGWPDTGVTPRRDAGFDAGFTDTGVPVVLDLSPVVQVLDLTPVSDPSVGPVLTGPSLEVNCLASAATGGLAVDPKSVTARVLSTTGEVLAAEMLSTRGVDIYGGTLSLAAVPSGQIVIRCQASDVNMAKPEMGVAEVPSYYDAGPVIMFQGLSDGSIVPRGDDKLNLPEFSIDFKVDPAFLAPGDKGAELSSVTLTVRDTDVEPKLGADGTYSYPVDFKTLVGATPINELKVAVTATNGRAATVTKQILLRVDGDPPIIDISSPASGSIVGGHVVMVMTITDALSGVSKDSSMTVAVLGDKPYVLTKTLVGSGANYNFDFDASSFPNQSNIPINITAIDNMGNKAVKGWSVKFDTVPPWVSLASPYVRECNLAQSTCSGRFKVLGDSPQDGQTVRSDVRFRALVWERGIIVEDAKQTWISGVSAGSVFLYAQSDATTPLLVDSDSNGICDSVDETGPVKLPLDAVGAGGTLPPSGTQEANDLASDPAVTGFGPLNTGLAPAKCSGSEMTYAITQSLPDRAPAVYAREVSSACTGISFNLGTGEGWTCVAAVAKDNSGNLGLSVPIRVCRMLKESDPHLCDGPAPSTLKCTDGCTLPAGTTADYLGSRIFAY